MTYRSGFCDPPTLDHDRHRLCHVPCDCPCHTIFEAAPGALWTLGDRGQLVTPTGVLITDAAPETEEWFAARREGITGTDLPKILGLSKYGNALAVWQDKRGEWTDDAGEAARWGQLLEEPVAEEWAERNDTIVERIGVVANVEYPWMRASLDRVITGSGLLPRRRR